MAAIVIGAGLAGLSCASALAAKGVDVIVVDKGRGVGGRLATRRIGNATFDHGAQFFTTRSPEFTSAVEGWINEGLVTTWSHGFDEPPDGYPRYAARGGMTALAKRLATGIDVRCSTLAFAIHPAGSGWRVALDDGTSLHANALVVTCPVPQSYSLLVTAGVSLPQTMLTGEYERTIALLACLDRPVSIGPFGAVQQGDPVFSMIADNVSKGVSAEPAVTFHASAAWSREHWDEPHVATHLALIREAERFLDGTRVIESQMKRWRFATPTLIWPDRCWVADTPAPLALAGDAFGGPRVEGAYLSGLAAAAAVLRAARQ